MKPGRKEHAMPSPFPGMNPFLEQEQIWHDFHERFCPLAAELLTRQVRPHYVVRIDEQVYIHEVQVRLPAVDIQRQSFLEIRDRASREFVTVLELLSPSNKYAGPDRDQYLLSFRRI
jgi:hypothetical protein